MAVSHFDIIRRNTDWTAAPESFPGGWHDAADYDRRPQHLSIVADLAALALVKGADGLGPVLDEADWELNHLRLAQTVDGGVGTWIETTRHPVEVEGMLSVCARPSDAPFVARLRVRAVAPTSCRATGPCRRRGLGHAPNLIGFVSPWNYHLNVTDGIAGDFGFVEDEMPAVLGQIEVVVWLDFALQGVLADLRDDGVMQSLFQCGTIRSCEPC